MGQTKRKTNMIIVPVEATPEELEAAAAKIGVGPDQLRRIMAFSETIRDEADKADMTPPEVVSASLNIIGELIRDFYPQQKQHLLLMDIHNQLTEVVGGADNGTTH
jgi:hypothetical protein